MDLISLTNQGCKTREAKRSFGTYTIGVANDQRMARDFIAQEITLLRTDIDVFSKQFVIINYEKLNAVG